MCDLFYFHKINTLHLSESKTLLMRAKNSGPIGEIAFSTAVVWTTEKMGTDVDVVPGPVRGETVAVCLQRLVPGPCVLPPSVEVVAPGVRP